MSSAFSAVLFLLTTVFGLEKTVAASFSTFAGLMSFLIFERQFIADKFSDMEKVVITSLQNRVYAEELDGAAEALRYINYNASSCRKIYNTRFRSSSSIASVGHERILKQHDEAILNAVLAGCEYQMVVDIKGISHLSLFECLPPIGATVCDGRFVLYAMDTAAKPLIQMTILIYKDGRKECLVGWDIEGNKTADMPVLLFWVRR